jgi:uncharacterized protein (TIGR00251 family)
MLEITENVAGGTVVFSVRLQPQASHDEVVGELQGALKIRVQAPAVDGRANEGLIDFLAQLLNLPKSAVRILSGERSRIKRVEMRGVSKRHIELLLQHDA